MTLQDFGALGEVVGAVGVVVSLLYLSVQVRQNTRSLRASTYQSFSEYFAEFRAMLLAEPRLGAVFGKGLRSFEQLDAAERIQFDSIMMTFLRGVEVSFYQERNGLLDAAYYRGWVEEAHAMGRQPGAREWWQGRAALFNEEFRAAWDADLARTRE
jgi:hypothetical protein